MNLTKKSGFSEHSEHGFIEIRYLPHPYLRQNESHFSRDKGLSSARTLVVEEDPVAGEHIVRLPEVDDRPGKSGAQCDRQHNLIFFIFATSWETHPNDPMDLRRRNGLIL